MATRISGVTITWGGVALTEPTEVEFSMERGLPLGRSTNWTLELGQVRILALENNALPASEYGRRKVLKCTLKDETKPTPQTITLPTGMSDGLDFVIKEVDSFFGLDVQTPAASTVVTVYSTPQLVVWDGSTWRVISYSS